MKKTNTKRFLSACALGVGLLAASFATPNRVAAQECPFANDEVILYHSPSTLYEAGPIPEVWRADEGRDALDALLKEIERKIDAEARDEDDFQRKLDYLEKKFKEGLGVEMSVRTVLKAYFEHIDSVVLAFDLQNDVDWSSPRQAKRAAREGFSLTYVVDFNPNEIDLARLFEKGDDLFVVKDEDGQYIAKIGDDDDDDETVYVGTTKIKGLDKYAAVFAATKRAVETKLSRFQETNEFVAKRLDEEKVYSEQIIKAEIFDAIAKELDKRDDEDAKNLKNALAKVKSAQSKAFAKDGELVLTFEAETPDEETANSLRDLAVGGIAILNLQTKDKNLKPEEEIGVKLLKDVKFSTDDATVRAELKIGFDDLKTLTKLGVWDKMDSRKVNRQIDEAIDEIAD